MDLLRPVPMATLAVGAGIVGAVAWIALDGTVSLVISIVAGGLDALKATVSDED